jgi:ligand-binding sensor domain-containing protein
VAATRSTHLLTGIVVASVLTPGCSSDRTAPEALPPAFPNNRVTSLAVDPNGSLWVGTDDGLGRLDGSDWTGFNATEPTP